jgi:hypothetical protein
MTVRPGQTGPSHPAWRGDQASQHTGHIRAERLFPDGQPCEVCASPFTGGHSIERHHRDGNTLNNSPENIAWLCTNHHAGAHRMRDGQERRSDKTRLRPSPIPPRAAYLSPLEDDGPMVAGNGWETAHSTCACGTDIIAANHPGMIQAAVTAHNATSLHRAWRAEQVAVEELRRVIPVKKCPCHGGNDHHGGQP